MKKVVRRMRGLVRRGWVEVVEVGGGRKLLLLNRLIRRTLIL